MPKEPEIAFPEEIDRASLARFFGISERSMTELKGKGILAKGSKRGWYTFEKSVRNYIEDLREKAAGRNAASQGQTLAEARTKLTMVQVEREEVELRKVQESWFSRDQVKEGWSRLLVNIRASVLSIPRKVGSKLPHLKAFDIDEIDKVCRDALTEVAENVSGSTAPGTNDATD